MHTIDAATLSRMIYAGAGALQANKEIINDLNVFPVPDGDTGTNMNMTFLAAVGSLEGLTDPDMSEIAKAISSGSLRGARGNSGVILSQLLRGFSKVIKDEKELGAPVIAKAFEKAVETAYKAVMKPKEGTILTVAKSMADKACEIAGQDMDLTDFFDVLLQEGDRTLQRTPDLLPVLKEAGVVDSGGQGLMTILHGAVNEYNGVETPKLDPAQFSPVSQEQKMRKAISTDDIKFGYCTEFIILLDREFGNADEMDLRSYYDSIGDSLVLVADDEVVKVHVHTNDPGLAIQKALLYGALSNMKIDNMRLEHREILFKHGTSTPVDDDDDAMPSTRKDHAFVTVCAGEGLTKIFHEIGADIVLSGGQTMNPSTEDLMSAIERANASDVYVLPNNKNIILAANQAAEMSSSCRVHVIPTKTVPQGIAAMIGFVREHSVEENCASMTDAASQVKSAEVTYAVRDTSIDGHSISEGDIISIGDDGLLSNGPALLEVIKESIGLMIDDDSELLSVYLGEDFPESDGSRLEEELQTAFSSLDIDVQHGGQPVYHALISVE